MVDSKAFWDSIEIVGLHENLLKQQKHGPFLNVSLCEFGVFLDGNGMEPAWTKRNPQPQVNNEGFCNSLSYLILCYGSLFCFIILRHVVSCYVMLSYIVVFGIVSFDKICSNIILFDVADSLLDNMIIYYIICYTMLCQIILYCAMLCHGIEFAALS